MRDQWLSHGESPPRRSPGATACLARDQDAFAAESQRRAEAARGERRFRPRDRPGRRAAAQGRPGSGDHDEYPRAGTTAEKLAALKTAFAKDGTVTAGNASGINDGAAALVIATAQKAQELGRTPLARILAYCTTGVDPMIMGMGPVEAIRKALDRANLSIDDIDLIELNEAFAAQSLAVVRELKLDPARGQRARRRDRARASDWRQRRACTHDARPRLQARGGGRGVASLCVGGGMGTAMIVESWR